jgi:hypothetical protein
MAVSGTAGGNAKNRQWPFIAGFETSVSRKRSGLLGVHLLGQAGNLAGRGFFVKDPFFGRCSNHGLGGLELIDSGIGIVHYGLTYILDDVFNPGLDRFVSHAPAFVLAGTFQC